MTLWVGLKNLLTLKGLHGIVTHLIEQAVSNINKVKDAHEYHCS